MKPRAKWTLMAYLAGDNNLSEAGDKDLAEMRAVGSTPDVNVLVEFDNAGNRGTKRHHIKHGGVDERVESLGETDSGSPQALIDFVDWAAHDYPADRYALVLWNHGSGWEPSEIDRIARQVNAHAYNPREASERSASPLGKVFFRSTLETIFRRPSASERAICSDDGTGHSLDTVELGKVLASAMDILGQPIDLLGMDACLMCNLEVSYQVQPFVRYLVASEESEPGDGWPYDAVLREFVDRPGLPTADLAARIVHDYIASYVSVASRDPVTQCALDLARVHDASDVLDRLADALVAQMPGVATEIWTAQRKSARFYHNTLWDINHFCEELGNSTSAGTVRQATQDVRAALQAGPGRFVIAESHHGPRVDHCGGISVYLLPPLAEISDYYADLGYAKEHRWLSMLRQYHAVR